MESEVSIQIRSSFLNESDAKLLMENCIQEKGNIINDQINIITHFSNIEERKTEENNLQLNEIIIDFESNFRKEDLENQMTMDLKSNSLLLENNQFQNKKIIKYTNYFNLFSNKYY